MVHDHDEFFHGARMPNLKYDEGWGVCDSPTRTRESPRRDFGAGGLGVRLTYLECTT